MQPDVVHSFDWPPHYDFFESTRLLRTGGNDPTVRRMPDGLWRTARLPEGDVTVRLIAHGQERIEVQAWGAGASAVIEQVPRWLGIDSPPWQLPSHPVTDRLLHDHPGIRLTDTGNVFDALMPTILQQLVTWQEAAFGWRRLVQMFGEPAPGPAGMMLAPTPRTVRKVGIEALMRTGISRQRARTLREAAFSATGLQRAAELPTPEAMRLLERVPGIGPWTSAMALGMYLGRPDPIVRGDVHLPNTVCWALAREPRGTDERMLELLANFPGQAFQVVRLIYGARIEAPRRGPRMAVRFGRR